MVLKMSQKNIQTILITGASRGLGLALARALACSGCSLILDGRDPAALEAARAELSQSTRVFAIPGDVSDPNHRAALRVAVEQAGGLDALVNNASILGSSPLPALLDYPLNKFERVLNVNLISPLALIQTLHRQFRPNPVVINITSDAALEAYQGWGGYGSSKAALEQMSSILAVENPGWHVYWVDPGDMRTQMHQEAFLGEDISDRPLPEVSVPGLLTLLEGTLPSGRYQARKVARAGNEISARNGG